MKTNIVGMIKRTSLPQSSKLLPMFECVVNSIQAIELKYKESGIKNGVISIDIIQSSELCNDIDNKIESFKIEDNGIGFNDTEMKAFNTCYTDNKDSLGCHGIGRILWLKAFDDVSIDSIYQQDNKIYQRRFSFNASVANKEINPMPEEVNVDNSETRTIVNLKKCRTKYQDSYKLQTVAQKLLTHLLEYYSAGNIPSIILKDKNGDSIHLDKLYEDNFKFDKSEEIKIKQHKFTLNHVHIDKSLKGQHTIALFAHNRLVEEINLDKKVNGLFDLPIHSDDKQVMYMCSVTSDYIDDNVNDIRTKMEIDDKNGSLFYDSEISIQDIENVALGKIKIYLEQYLEDNRIKSEQRINEFIEANPKYKPIREEISQKRIVVKYSISDTDLEEKLHLIYSEIAISLKKENQKKLKKQLGESYEQYGTRLNNFVKNTSKICQSDLISYICRRKVVLEMLDEYIQPQDDEKFVKEEVIHKLIMPLKTDSIDSSFEELNNLWLIDEKLSCHKYIASDRTFKQIPHVLCDGKERPDILSLPKLFTDNDKKPFESIVIVEIKRPGRKDEDNKPIDQILNYIDKMKNSKAITDGGRPISVSSKVRVFGYIISDFTGIIKQQCDRYNFRKSADESYYFGYIEQYNAYIEVISFDGLLQNAKQRNQAFFDKIKYL